MSKNYVFYSCISKHGRRNLSGIGSALFKIHVFSSNLDIGSLACFYYRNYINCGYAEYDIDILACY